MSPAQRDDEFPVQAPADPAGVAAQLASMQQRADEVIRRASADTGPVDERYASGCFELAAAMRPTFGPANAWLFTERGRKVGALAKTLGVARREDEAETFSRLDEYFTAVESARQALEGAGLVVREGPSSTAAVDWRPRRPGRALRAEDPSRSVPPAAPYAGAPGAPDRTPAPAAAVPPAVTLHLFPRGALSTTLRLVTREQPGHLAGALPGALVFVGDPARSGDSDDGQVQRRALDAACGSAPAEQDAALAKELGATSATRHHGVLSLAVPSDWASPVPAGLKAVHAVVVTSTEGSTAVQRVLP